MYDIAGGAMWGNKSDNIISYYRPQFHVDKNSPAVEIFIQKVKRKRTGGQLGSFSLTFNWNKKRFSNPITGNVPCNPSEAEKCTTSPLHEAYLLRIKNQPVFVDITEPKSEIDKTVFDN